MCRWGKIALPSTQASGIPKSNTKTYGDRTFSVNAPREWNMLPLDVRLSNSVDSFKRNLKTHLFKQAF